MTSVYVSDLLALGAFGTVAWKVAFGWYKFRASRTKRVQQVGPFESLAQVSRSQRLCETVACRSPRAGPVAYVAPHVRLGPPSPPTYTRRSRRLRQRASAPRPSGARAQWRAATRTWWPAGPRCRLTSAWRWWRISCKWPHSRASCSTSRCARRRRRALPLLKTPSAWAGGSRGRESTLFFSHRDAGVQAVRQGRLRWRQLSSREQGQVLAALDGLQLDGLGKALLAQAPELAKAWLWQVRAPAQPSAWPCARMQTLRVLPPPEPCGASLQPAATPVRCVRLRRAAPPRGTSLRDGRATWTAC